MKTIVLATVLALAAAAPALAKTSDNSMHPVRHHAMSSHAALVAPDPYGAYVDGQRSAAILMPTSGRRCATNTWSATATAVTEPDRPEPVGSLPTGSCRSG